MRIAITGGLCSGKSAIAAELRELGWPVADADALGHQLLGAGQPAVAEIARVFGAGVLNAAGGVDRPRLAARVFDPGPDAEPARKALNCILHLRIMAAIDAQFSQWEREGQRLVAAEAALFLEEGMQARFDRVIVVTCGIEERVRRFTARTGGTREHALARIASQWTDAEKIKFADFVIDNGAELEETRRQVRNAAAQLRAEAAATA